MDATLPQTLFVHMEDSGDEDYFPVGDTTIEGLQNGTVVGVYELKETKTVTVKTELA